MKNKFTIIGILFVSALIFSAPVFAATSKVLLLKTKNNPKVYAVINNTRVPVGGLAEFKEKGYSWKNLKVVTEKKLNAIPLATIMAPVESKSAIKNTSVEAAPSIAAPQTIVVVPAITTTSAASLDAPSVTQSSTADVSSDQNITSDADIDVLDVPMVSNYIRPATMQIVEVSGSAVTTQMQDINNRGQILMKDFEASKGKQVFVWENGARTYIPGAKESVAIGDGGQVLFLGDLVGGKTTLGMWNNGKTILYKNFSNKIGFVWVYTFSNQGVAIGSAFYTCPGEYEVDCGYNFVASPNGLKIIGASQRYQFTDDREDIFEQALKTYTGNFTAAEKDALAIWKSKLAVNKAINSESNGGKTVIFRKNDYGQATGQTTYYQNNSDFVSQQDWFFWDKGVKTMLQYYGFWVDLNNKGEVLAGFYGGYRQFTERELNNIPADFRQFINGSPAYWYHSRFAILNQLLPANSNVILSEPIAINGNGQIIASGVYLDGHDYYNFLVNLPANFPPTFQFTRDNLNQPGNQKEEMAMEKQDRLNNVYTIKWISDDVEDSTTVSLYYSLKNSGADGTLIVKDINQLAGHNDGQYVWDTSVIRQSWFKKDENGNIISVEVKDCTRGTSGIGDLPFPSNDCVMGSDAYYLYAVISDGVNPSRTIYSKMRAQM